MERMPIVVASLVRIASLIGRKDKSAAKAIVRDLTRLEGTIAAMSEAPNNLVKTVRDVFLVPANFTDAAAGLITRLERLPSRRKVIAQAFVESLHGVVQTLSIPYKYTYSQVHSLHWQRISMAERIRALQLDNEDEREDAARIAAQKKFREFLAGENGDRIANEVLDRLAILSEEDDSLAAARELTRQGVVLVWSAFEVFSRDLFVELLNVEPGWIDRLLANPASRKRFTVEKVDWQTLTSFGFDLSSSLGTFLAQRTDLDDIQTIRDAYGALFPNAIEVNRRLADPLLWLLFQKRNLIVHRRGIVDQHYLEKTGDGLSLGASMWVAPSDVECVLKAVISAGEEIVNEVVNVG